MSIGRTVEAQAQGKTMTLAEMRAFVAELDRAAAAETTPVSARVNFGGGIKSLKATAARFGDVSPRKVLAELDHLLPEGEQ